MNTLDKMFGAIKAASSPRLKEYATNELIRQLCEFEDHVLFVLRSIYQLLTSDNGESRVCAARILRAVKMFRYEGTFELRAAATEHVYLQARDILESDGVANASQQRAGLIKKLKLSHADQKFLDRMVQEQPGSRDGLRLNTADIEEKSIENVHDFYEAINVLIFSPDWYKRHGALLAYISIFESIQEQDGGNGNEDDGASAAGSNMMTVKLNPNLFSKIYEILKNDKFNDFIDNQTSAPVRETAATLLRHLYVYIKDTKVVEIFMEFLSADDWQEQFSGLIVLLRLKEYLAYEERLAGVLVDKLEGLLESADEDVKYMSAELLDYIIVSGRGDHGGADAIGGCGGSNPSPYAMPSATVDRIVEICWRQIGDEADIAHSKASLLILIKDIYGIYKKEVPASISSLYPCFTSPVKMIRESVVELCRIFRNEECLYLLGESILLSGDREYSRRTGGVLLELVGCSMEEGGSRGTRGDGARGRSAVDGIMTNLFTHFSRIISLSLYAPYKEDDFACFNDSFFTKDGIQSLGYDFVLENRLILYKILHEIHRRCKVDLSMFDATILGVTLKGLLRGGCGDESEDVVLVCDDVVSAGQTGNDKDGDEVDGGSDGSSNGADAGVSVASTNGTATAGAGAFCSLQSYLLGVIDGDFKRYPFLKRMPIKEYKAIISDPSYTSLLMLCNEHALDYVRMTVANNIGIADISLYYQLETCEEALRLVTQRKIRNGVGTAMIRNMYELLIEEVVWCRNRVEDAGETRSGSKSGRNRANAGKGGTAVQSGSAGLPISVRLKNFVIFFEELGSAIFSRNVIDFIMNDKDRLLFFELTVKYYIPDGTGAMRGSAGTCSISKGTPAAGSASNAVPHILDTLFYQALAANNIQILKHFISSLDYNQVLVKHLLSHFNPALLSDLLDYSDPSFNILFINLILQNPYPGLLSKIIPSLYFGPNPKISGDLLSSINSKRSELLMLIDPAKIPSYSVNCEVSISLRDYQKEGVRWMAFLNRFGLNGVLADDMGLGKTIQVLTYMVSEMSSRGGTADKGRSNGIVAGKDDAVDGDVSAVNYKSGSEIASDGVEVSSGAGSRSLIVCPSSLTTHWESELKAYFNKCSQIYSSRSKELSSSIIIASYDNIRRDAGILADTEWFMVVFDEGHLLKSRNTQLYAKAAALRSPRKFILTGTPVHNTVDDLFSLFNIIMPGYLGTEASFSSTYMVKITEKNVDAMENRLGMLHKKVLPFIMRRLKTEVLKDLPPKIIKDVTVELSPEHMAIYRGACGDADGSGATGDMGNAAAPDTAQNYQSLRNANSLLLTRNMLKAASHPFHFNPSVPSSKTAALKDILSMCGERKVLIFFQLKKTIDFVIEELNIASYLRLDGTLPAAQRGAVVSRFNSESVQYLFLTTSIGGLGLNLVSADTVVFYEHDWNPFNDLQAMDRAHRLGQKRVVNVFRLISKGTIEEKVMNYQNFKVFVASSIVTQQNTDVEKMDTKDLLERFE